MIEITTSEKIVSLLNPISFHNKIERIQDDYFPESLRLKLDFYYQFYCDKLYELVDIDIDWDGGQNDWIKNRLKRLSDGIVYIVNLYYKGELVEAGNKFFELMDEDFRNIKPTKIIPARSVFYRARLLQGWEYNPVDLFHVSFDNRHLLSSSRYSAPGLPCLYLGDSSFVCWEELNRVDFSNLWFSKFENAKDLRIVDLVRPDELNRRFNEKNRDRNDDLTMVLRYLCAYPLYIASSIKVAKRDGDFKPEYIIPQLLIQYITNKDEIDGIRFPSSKVIYSDLNGVQASNYAFPVRTAESKGYCKELKSRFKVSEPASFEIVSLLESNQRSTNPIIEISEGKLKLANIENSYSNTAFGRLEIMLDQRECDFLD